MKFVTSENFKEEILKSKFISLVMFWSYDCLACDMANSYLFKLSEAYKDKMNFFKVDSQKNIDIVTSYGVDIIPTFIFFENSKICGRIEGFKKKFEIEKKIRDFL